MEFFRKFILLVAEPSLCGDPIISLGQQHYFVQFQFPHFRVTGVTVPLKTSQAGTSSRIRQYLVAEKEIEQRFEEANETPKSINT